jgi:hypothetical protein
MNSVTNCCRDVKNTLGLLEELHVFMNGHKRNDVFMQARQVSKGRKQQLKRVSNTRWNSTEAAIETVLSNYQEVLETLKLLSQPDYHSETATQATGLLARLQDFRVILCMHVLQTIYSYIGPASRQLQGLSIDLASATTLLHECKGNLKECRANADSLWEKLYNDSVDFAAKHSAMAEVKETSRRKKKKLDDESCPDESLSGKEKFKVDTFIQVLDEVSQQLNSRFGDDQILFMKQFLLFTPAGLINGKEVSMDKIQDLCTNYSLDPTEVYAEMVQFRETHCVCSKQTMHTSGRISNHMLLQ